MKTTIFSMTAIAFGLLSFAKGQKERTSNNTITEINVTQTTFSTNSIVTGYLKIKNTLVKSDTKGAAQAAEVLLNVFTTLNETQLSGAQKKVLTTIAEGSKKQIKTIIANNGKLDKQRKAFQSLSKNINELVSTFGTTQKLYQDFCPMYEGGSIWISETNEIKNPYYGSQMLNCGKVKEVF